MRAVSDAYMQAVSGNVIPKCEPIITLKFKDASGAEQSIKWQSKDIKSFNYKQGFDPLGRTLPFIEATWTEIYYGEFDENNEPTKYNNVGQYGLVEIEFEQQLTRGFTTWGFLKSKGVKWGDLKDKTWGEVARGGSTEKIAMPKLFLSAKPEFNNNTITWKAVDLLSIFNGTQDKIVGFDESFTEGGMAIPIKGVFANTILDERAGFVYSPYVIQAITDTVAGIQSDDVLNNIILNKPFLMKGTTKDCLLNLATANGCYIEFDGGGIKISTAVGGFTDLNPFTNNVLKNPPILTKNPVASSYQYKVYSLALDKENPYQLSPEVIIKDGVALAYWFFDGYGTITANAEVLGDTLDYKQSVMTADTLVGKPIIEVSPITQSSRDGYKQLSTQGEAFVEDNPLNVYDIDDDRLQSRIDYISNFYGGNTYSLEFSAFPNLAFELGDVVGVETNLTSSGNKIIKRAMIVEYELSYNGALSEKIKAHEV